MAAQSPRTLTLPRCPPCPSPCVAAVTKASLLYPTFCLALSTPLCLLLSRQQWPGLAAAAAAWRSGALLVYGWSVGAHLLEVVFTERVAMADDSDPAPTAPLLAALQHKDPIVQVRLLLLLLLLVVGGLLQCP